MGANAACSVHTYIFLVCMKVRCPRAGQQGAGGLALKACENWSCLGESVVCSHALYGAGIGTAICCAACAWMRTVPAGVSIIVYRREFGGGHNAGLVCLRQRIKVIGVVVADLQQLGQRRSRLL